MKAPNVTAGEWTADNGDVYSKHDGSIEGDIVCEAPKTWDESMQYWPANAKMLAASKKLAEALNDALPEIRQTIKEIGPCDHGANLCICGLVSLADQMKTALLAAGYTED